VGKPATFGRWAQAGVRLLLGRESERPVGGTENRISLRLERAVGMGFGERENKRRERSYSIGKDINDQNKGGTKPTGGGR